MSADMMLNCLVLPIKRPDNETIRKNLLNKLETYTKKNIKSFEDYYETYDIENNIDKIKEDVKELINNVIDIIEGRRDVSNFVPYADKEEEWFFSGGLSYGDAPTEAYEIINKFSLLPQELQDAGGFKC